MLRKWAATAVTVAAVAAPGAPVLASPFTSHKPPPGATARCRDGTYSFSKHRRGTCSWHHGVAVWLRQVAP